MRIGAHTSSDKSYELWRVIDFRTHDKVKRGDGLAITDPGEA